MNNDEKTEINPGDLFKIRFDNTIVNFNRMLQNSGSEFQNIMEQLSGRFKKEVENARTDLEESLYKLSEECRQAVSGDWREEIIKQFSSWLYNLTDEEFNVMNSGIDPSEPPPDILSFFNELSSLKQEIRLQTKTATSLNEKTGLILETVKDEFSEQGHRLQDTAADLKSQLPKARQEGEDKILMEFVKIRDELCRTIEVLKNNKNLKKWFFSKKKDKNSSEYIKSFQMLLYKIDDAFNRLNIISLCEVGMPFDASFMRVLATSVDSGYKPGTVTRVLRQGYKINERILQIVEVQVEKEGEGIDG